MFGGTYIKKILYLKKFTKNFQCIKKNDVKKSGLIQLYTCLALLKNHIILYSRGKMVFMIGPFVILKLFRGISIFLLFLTVKLFYFPYKKKHLAML
jgi:hypothetical protein